MDVGQNLKELRRRKGLTLREVAEAADVSKGFVSQIERGNANPSIGVLKRIADVLGVTLGALVDGDSAAQSDGKTAEEGRTTRNDLQIVRSDRRKMIAWPGSRSTTFLLTPDLQRKLEVILDVYEPGEYEQGELYTHEGEEFGLILEGRYEITVDNETHVLDAGDSVYFSSTLPHHMRPLPGEHVKTLWVITPPSF